MYQQKLGPHATVGFSKAMSAGWLQVDKKAEGGPKVLRKVGLQLHVLNGNKQPANFDGSLLA